MNRMIQVQKVITNGKIQILRRYCFLGHILCQLPVVYSDLVQTMGVGKMSQDEIQVKLYINKRYVQELFQKFLFHQAYEHILQVLKHQIYHIIFNHLTLDLQDKNRQQIACELSVNSYIDRSKLRDVKEQKCGIFPQDYGFSDKLGIHEYYRLLQDKTGESKSLDSHEYWKILNGDKLSQGLLKDIVKKSVKICKQSCKWGQISGQIKQLVQIENGISINIPWRVYLSRFIGSSIREQISYSMKRISRRFGTRPGIKKDFGLRLAIGIDVSGSMQRQKIQNIFTQIQNLLRQTDECMIYQVDTAIKRMYRFSEWDGMIKGRGGTDLQVLLKQVDEVGYDALIYFTDMETPKIKGQYFTPCLWVIDNDYYKSISELPYQKGIFLRVVGQSYQIMN